MRQSELLCIGKQALAIIRKHGQVEGLRSETNREAEIRQETQEGESSYRVLCHLAHHARGHQRVRNMVASTLPEDLGHFQIVDTQRPDLYVKMVQ